MGVYAIAVFVGSLRRESFTRGIARSLIACAPESLQLEFVELGGLPVYNQDFDDDSPVAYSAFREFVRTHDGFLFATPEYNRSVPAVLKNAVDVGSRPYGKSVWNAKPAAVISVSVGPIGGFGANQHLRQSLMCLNVPVMPNPEAYIGNAASLFDANGTLSDGPTLEFLAKFMKSFAHWVSMHART